MVGKTVIAGIIGCSVIAVVLLAAFYSYQEVRIVNVDVDITDIKIGTTGLLTGIMKLLTGDISGLFYAIEHIELRITTDIQNDGFLPMIKPYKRISSMKNSWLQILPIAVGYTTLQILREVCEVDNFWLNFAKALGSS